MNGIAHVAAAFRQGFRVAGTAPGHRRAFTLIELVVTLTVIAVAATIAIPRYGRSQEHYRAEAAARRIVADLSYARHEALITSAAREVSFDVGAETYTATQVAGLNGGSGPYVVDVGREPYRASLFSVLLDDPGDPGDDPDAVVFDAFGAPDSGGAIVISAGGAWRTVVLDADSGEAEVQ